MGGADDENFFEGSDYDWNAYLVHRADYKLSGFYPIVFDYHAAHSNRWASALDVGAGPGMVSRELAPRFDHVAVSDISEFHVRAAQANLAEFANLSFTTAPAEQLAAHFAAGSADFVAVPECIGLLDPPAAMAAFAHVVRPGGTLAIWFYGGPIFTEPGHERIQHLYRKCLARSDDEYRGLANFDRGMTTLHNWVDSVALPAEHWANVKRIKWNPDWPLNFEDEEEAGFVVPRINAVRPDEEVQHVTDRTWWAKTVNFDWARNSIDNALPHSRDYKTPEVLAMFDELQQLMGPPDRLHHVAFPAILILATRK